MAVARLEPLTSMVRIYDDDDGDYGDGYNQVVTLRYLEPDVVEVMGAVKHGKEPAFSLPRLRALRKLFREMGLRQYVFFRMVDGEKVRHTVEI